MLTFVIAILFLSRLLYLLFYKYRNLILYPEFIILVPPLIIFIIPSALNNFETLSAPTNFGLIIIFILSFIDSKVLFKKINFKKKRLKIYRRFFIKLMTLLSVIYLIMLIKEIYFILKSNSIIDIFLSNRLKEYFQETISTGSAFGTFSIILSYFYFLKISDLFNKRKFKMTIFFVFIEIIYLLFFAVTRLSIVFPIISIIMFLLYFFRTSLKKSILFSTLSLIIIIFYMSISNSLRTGEGYINNFTFKESAEKLLGELDYDQYNEMAINYTKLHGYEYGYGWYLGAVVNIIPRFIYANKPITSSSNRFTEKVTGSPPSLYNPVITPTLVGDGFIQFGYIGVLFGLSLFYVFTSIIFWRLYYLPNSIGVYPAIRFSFIAFIYFRAEIPFIHFFIFLFLTYLTNIMFYPDEKIKK